MADETNQDDTTEPSPEPAPEPKPEESKDEALSDEQLEEVSGGMGLSNPKPRSTRYMAGNCI